MKTSEVQQIKARIVEQIAFLENEITLLQEKTEPITPDCCLGDLTRFEMMHEQEIFLRSLESAHLRLSKLQYLLPTIDTNADYGFCAECGDEIPFQRLLLLLETRYCIHCAS